MTAPRPVEISGGGLAGLSLGLALRQQGIPVTLWEAGAYPRAKVCGEFIAGLDATTTDQLGLEPLLRGHRHHQEASWHGPDRRLFRQRLPRAALGVSRHKLDTDLAAAFVAAGGDLRTGRRLPPSERPGRVQAHGRRRGGAGWLGLKLHLRGLALDGDLELHLGNRAYVGLAGVEEGRVNVCGLFAPRRLPPGPPELILDRHLRAAGLGRLADRLASHPVVDGSRAAVAGAQFGRRRREGGACAIGDAFAAIPPFTGHGMAMALQGAALALEPVTAWSNGRSEWEQVVRRVERRLRRRFSLRLALAELLHPWLLAPRSQALMARLQARRALPLGLLYHALH